MSASPISSHIDKMISGDTGIRGMFEEGLRMKKELGPENVFDFSLGNPDLPPPQEFEVNIFIFLEFFFKKKK